VEDHQNFKEVRALTRIIDLNASIHSFSVFENCQHEIFFLLYIIQHKLKSLHRDSVFHNIKE